MLNHTLVTPRTVARAHAIGVPVLTWTVDDPAVVLRVVEAGVDAVISNAGMQRWLAEEGEQAMRLLTRRETGFQPRLIDAMYELLREESDAGRLDLPVDLHEVAYVIVRLIESYTYLDLITGEQPDARRAESVVRLLLR